MKKLALLIATGSLLLFLTSCIEIPSIFEILEKPDSLGPVTISALLAAGTLVSEDLACVTAGVLAAQGVAPYLLVSFACFVGIWVGDLGLFGLGRISGTRWRNIRPFCWFISERRIEAGRKLFARHGSTFIFTSRFLPGSRLPVYMAAGMLGFPFLRFAGWMAVACLIWVPVIVGLAMLVGESLLKWLSRYEQIAWLVAPITIAALWFLSHFIISLLSYRGRRLLVSRWYRFIEWEFWPMWRFYPPVIAYLVWLAIKHRSLTVFTLSNPAIPLGGLALESKSEILEAIRRAPDGPKRVARFQLIAPGESEERLTQVDHFRAAESLDFPIVLKPDVGERGQGVAVVRSRDDADTFLKNCRHPVIAQEYISGPEFGVFYYRYPNEEKGHLLSITEKKLPTILGDGQHTLEHLILSDSRALRMAPFFLKKWESRLLDIPKKGEVISLTELGTHCRGAVFLNGEKYLNEAVLHTFDSLSRNMDGFHFGRYDVRVPNPEEFESGEGWKVLELNGVSAESTHIYHPGYSLMQAYRDLFKQWRIAFEIGALIRSSGATPPTPIEIWRTIRAHANHDWYEAEETNHD